MKFVVCVFVVGVALLFKPSEAQQKKVVCYYTNWSNYRQGLGKFTPDNVDPHLCTHILYAFTVLRGNKMTIFDDWLDNVSGFFNKMVALKQRNPALKVMIAVGGWNNGGYVFSQMASTKAGRAEFIKSSMDLIMKYGFDGVDLDWEYPGVGSRGGRPEDKENFSLLIQEFQAAFRAHARRYNTEKPLLSSAVGPAPKTANVAYDKYTICRDLDFVNLMQYDIHGAWEKRTGFLAPLDVVQGEETPENVLKTTTDDWIKAGCPPSKLIFGLPTYGRGWKTRYSDIHSPATGPSQQGKYTGESGILSYYEICEKISKDGWSTEYYPEAAEAVAYSSRAGEIVTYDNKQSMMDKVDYINRLGLGGAMIWALDFDDFTGKFCNEGRYPLLTTINQRLGKTAPPRTTRRPRTTTRRPRTTRTTRVPRTTTTRRPNRTTRRPNRTTRRPITTTNRQTNRTRMTTRSDSDESTTTRRPNNCRPDCSREMHGSYHLDPCDKRKFHVCVRKTVYSFMCPPGTVFFLSSYKCDYPQRG